MALLGADTETSLVSAAEPVPRLVSSVFAYGRNADLIHHKDPASRRIWRAALEEDTLSIANGPFDLTVVAERYRDLEPLVWQALENGQIYNPLTNERLLDLADGKGLKRRKYGLGPVAFRRCGIEMDKDDPWRKNYVMLIDVPIRLWPEEAKRYAIDDGIAHLKVAKKQLKYARQYEKDTGLNPLEDGPRQTRGHWALHLQSVYGICTDPVAVAKLDKETSAELRRVQKRLRKEGLVRADGSRDTKAAMEVMRETCRDQGIKPIETKKGVSLSEKALSMLDLSPDRKGRDHTLTAYQKYGSIMTLRSSVLNGLRDPVLHTWFTELMENGRTSSSDPNLQNLPRVGGFRECLVPAPGNVFVVADYKGAELVTWAQVLVSLFGEDAETSALAKALRDGVDAHALLGADLGMDNPKDARQCAKAGNFGFPGGLGIKSFLSYAKAKWGVHLTMKQAMFIKEVWEERWKPWGYFDYIKDNMEGGQIDCVQFKSNRIRAGCFFTDACNTFFSGLAADLAKDCMWRLAKEMWITPSSDLYGARQVLFVHDENVLECKRSQADKVAARLSRVMIDTAADWCPDVPMGVEVAIKERYGKD